MFAADYWTLKKFSETAENKGLFVICSPNPFIKCYTVSINIRAAHKGKNKGSIHQKPYAAIPAKADRQISRIGETPLFFIFLEPK